MTKIKQTITEYLYKFTINSPVSQHKSTLSMHAGQRPRCISLVYFRLWAGYFRTLQLLSNQTANEGGRGGSHQEQTACPLSFNPISSLSSCFLYQTPLTPLPQLSSRRILQPRFWNTDSANQNVYYKCVYTVAILQHDLHKQKTRDDIPSANSILAAFPSVFPCLENNNTCIRMLFF